MEIDYQVQTYSGVDGLIVPVFEGEKEKIENLAWFRRNLAWLADMSFWREFKCKKGKALASFAPGSSLCKIIIPVGLGEKSKFDSDAWYSACAESFKQAKQYECSTVGVPFPIIYSLFEENPHWYLREMLFTGVSALYEYKELKTMDAEDEDNGVRQQIVLLDQEPDGAVADVLAYIKSVKNGLYHARDLITRPSNEITPTTFAEEARKVADTYGMRWNLISLEQAKEMGMGAFVAVAQGSQNGGCISILEYCPVGCESERPLVLVGKGITFDTGGISLKPAQNMEQMKHDMAGAAAVLGAMEVIGILKPPRRVVGIMPCAENMPDGKAYRPGDVVKTLSGKTVEVISTDAEGRLILCDAITYGIKNYNPAVLVDIATLTGACIIALGDRVAGVMGNDDELVSKLCDLGAKVGEKMWPLPLWDFFFEDMKSDIADFKNVGNRKAGTIVGGMFLKQFVEDSVKWAHIDIAGPAWADKPWFQMPKGATGFGIRTFVEMVKSWNLKPDGAN